MSYTSGISINKKFIFIHICKNAGTSLNDYFLPYYDYNQEIKLQDNFFSEYKKEFHFTIKDICCHFKEKNIDKDEFKFIVSVRNPYERMISIYNYRNIMMPFKEYVLKGHFKKNSRGGRDYERMTKTQTFWLKDENDEINWNNIIIIKVETIEDDLKSCCNTLNIENNNLKKLNTSKNLLKNYYDQETKDYVYQYFKEDFINFNYNK